MCQKYFYIYFESRCPPYSFIILILLFDYVSFSLFMSSVIIQKKITKLWQDFIK